MFKPGLMAVGGFRHRRSVVCRSFPPLPSFPPPRCHRSPAIGVSMAESIQGPSSPFIRDTAAACICICLNWTCDMPVFYVPACISACVSKDMSIVSQYLRIYLPVIGKDWICGLLLTESSQCSTSDSTHDRKSGRTLTAFLRKIESACT